MNYTTEIKSQITMPELLNRYGFNVRRNRLQCPLHGGHDYNCGVKDNYIHCFVCGESADVITFTMRIYNLGYMDAVKMLDRDFNLGLGIGERITKRQRLSLERKAYERQKKIKDEQRRREEVEANYWAVFDEWKRLSDNKKKYRPKAQDEELDERFVEALQKLSYQEYLLDMAEIEVRKLG